MAWTYVKVYMPREMKQLLTEIAEKEAYISLSEFLRSLARNRILASQVQD